ARAGAVTPNPAAGWTHVVLLAWDGGPFSGTVLNHAVAAVADAFSAAADSATAQRVREMLGELQARSDGRGPAAVSRYVANTLTPRLQEELAAARDKGYSRLIPLLESTIAQSGKVAAVAGAAEAKRAAGVAGAGGQETMGQGREGNPLDTLLGRLGLPPSVPPASSQKLARSYGSTFAGAGDVFPKLLASLDTALAPSLYSALANTPVSLDAGLAVYAMRQSASLFGHNAPVLNKFNADGVPEPLPEWDLAGDEQANTAHLDAAHPTVLPGEVVIAQRGPATGGTGFAVVLATVKAAATVTRRAYGMAGKSTTLILSGPWWNPVVPPILTATGPASAPASEAPEPGAVDAGDDMTTLRGSTFYLQPEQLRLAQAPVTDDVAGTVLELDGLYDGLTAGRWAVVAGERTDVGTGQAATAGVAGAELVMLAGVSQGARTLDGAVLDGEDRHTTLTLAQSLAYTYKRDTVTVSGNVAHATHGETRVEVLGAGNAAASMQKFTLKQFPLSYVSAPTAAGAASTLVVRVNQVQWHEAPGLAYLSAGERGFLTSVEPAGTTTVTFGNGVHGQRLPTGVENVGARYRSGIGAPGNVLPGQISQLATRPLGVSAVNNPLRSTGGADPETRDAARANAPLAVTALDRLVSVADYADFARTFAG
ncbi:MAG: hypothetical protein WBX27_18945, partial [Specibacter sp.]